MKERRKIIKQHCLTNLSAAAAAAVLFALDVAPGYEPDPAITVGALEEIAVRPANKTTA